MDEQQTTAQPELVSNPGKESNAPYRVLARKYRPATFSELIGQEAMVRTLTNAIDSGRLAHAFILTGVRGIGKTTTARLIARALNYIGADGTGGPTISPCGVCEHCLAIAGDRHMDVIEMDAASRTGVDDIREVIEGVQYRPTTARTKIYIIDEVHMLSRSAFNALLKTLEEPPEHVKFVFATTEVRKVPVTVLSRCQRFDLRRVDAETLTAHFAAISAKENATITLGALQLISRAADGSVRDGLSLLDQAIAHCTGEIDENQVRGMIGLADRTRTFDLLEAVMKGDAKTALTVLSDLYSSGADPTIVVEDMLELVHWLTRVRLVPEVSEDPGVPEAERVRGRDMAKTLSMPVLTRAWQMLLKGVSEARIAPSSLQAVEMVLVRLAYAASLPTPAEAIESLTGGGVSSPGAGSAGGPIASSTASEKGGGPTPDATENSHSGASPTRAAAAGGTIAEAPPQPADFDREPVEVEPAKPDPGSFEEVVELALVRKEMILRANLRQNVHLVSFEPGKIEFRPTDTAPNELAHDLSRFLNAHTARRWLVTVSGQSGEPTLQERADAADATRKSDAAKSDLVRAVIDTFPGAEITKVQAPNWDRDEDQTSESD